MTEIRGGDERLSKQNERRKFELLYKMEIKSQLNKRRDDKHGNTLFYSCSLLIIFRNFFTRIGFQDYEFWWFGNFSPLSGLKESRSVQPFGLHGPHLKKKENCLGPQIILAILLIKKKQKKKKQKKKNKKKHCIITLDF